MRNGGGYLFSLVVDLRASPPRSALLEWEVQMAEPVVKVESLTKSFVGRRHSCAKEEVARGQDVSVDISRGEGSGLSVDPDVENPLRACWSGFTPVAVTFDWVDGMPRRCLRRSETE